MKSHWRSFFFFFHSYLKGHEGGWVYPASENARHKAPADWIQLLLKVGGGRRRGKFTHVLFCRLFRASALSLIHSICLEQHTTYKHCEYTVSAVSIRSSFSPHSHLRGCIWVLLTTGHGPALHSTSVNTFKQLSSRAWCLLRSHSDWGSPWILSGFIAT